MSIGFFMRIAVATYPNSLPIFMVQQLFIILPPAAYLAFNYILYGRFIVNCVDRRHSWINPEKVAKYFVISDITTFLIQASICFDSLFSVFHACGLSQGGGGGLEASTNQTSDKLGTDILLAGIVIQALSFALFMLLVVHAWRSILRDGILPRQEPWGPILRILMFSSTGYMVRRSFALYLVHLRALMMHNTDTLYLSCHRACSREWWLSPYARKWVSEYLIRGCWSDFPMSSLLLPARLPATFYWHMHIYCLLANEVFRKVSEGYLSND